MSGEDSQGAKVLGVTVAFFLAAALLTIVRLLTRILIVRDFGPEDWTIGLATLFSLLVTICIDMQVQYGLGKHFNTIAREDYIRSLKPFWTSIWIYYMSLTFTKISILFQYHRVLTFRRTRYAVWVLMGVVTAYGISTFFDSIFICFPVSQFWSSDRRDGSCVDEATLWYSNAAVNIALDVAIVVLPMHAVKSLTISKARKLGVMCLFALYGFVTITSCIRLYTLRIIARSHDVTWDNVNAAIWSCIEVNVGIFCACLPAVRPLFSYLHRGRVSHKSHVRMHEEGEGVELPVSNPQSDVTMRRASEFGSEPGDIGVAIGGHERERSVDKVGRSVEGSVHGAEA